MGCRDLDTRGNIFTTALVLKYKGYLRRDDGRHDSAARDTFAALDEDRHSSRVRLSYRRAINAYAVPGGRSRFRYNKGAHDGLEER